MSIDLQSTTDEAIVPADAAINSLDAMTLIAIYRVDLITGGAYVLAEKRSTSQTDGWSLFRPFGQVAADDWWFFHHRATTDTSLQSNGNIIQANRWEFLAVMDSDGVAPQILHGPLNSLPVEPTYTRTTGVGAVADDSAHDLTVGHNSLAVPTQSFDGQLGFFGLWNKRMSLAEVKAQWRAPYATPESVLFSYPGYDGSATFVDLSGNANNGAVSGTSSYNNPPLSNLFGLRTGGIVGAQGFTAPGVGLSPLSPMEGVR